MLHTLVWPVEVFRALFSIQKLKKKALSLQQVWAVAHAPGSQSNSCNRVRLHDCRYLKIWNLPLAKLFFAAKWRICYSIHHGPKNRTSSSFIHTQETWLRTPCRCIIFPHSIIIISITYDNDFWFHYCTWHRFQALVIPCHIPSDRIFFRQKIVSGAVDRLCIRPVICILSWIEVYIWCSDTHCICYRIFICLWHWHRTYLLYIYCSYGIWVAFCNCIDCLCALIGLSSHRISRWNAHAFQYHLQILCFTV